MIYFLLVFACRADDPVDMGGTPPIFNRPQGTNGSIGNINKGFFNEQGAKGIYGEGRQPGLPQPSGYMPTPSAPSGGGYAPQLERATGNVCQTPMGIGIIQGQGPVGAQCFLQSPTGPVQGVIIATPGLPSYPLRSVPSYPPPPMPPLGDNCQTGVGAFPTASGPIGSNCNVFVPNLGNVPGKIVSSQALSTLGKNCSSATGNQFPIPAQPLGTPCTTPLGTGNVIP